MALNLMSPPEFEADDSSVTVTPRLGSAASPAERAWLAQTLTNKVVRSLLGIDASRASKALARLRDRGLLQQRGAGAGAHYTLSPNIARPDGIRREQRDYEAEVLGLALAGSITNTDVRAATGLDRTAAVRIFNRLVADGLLERHGSRRGTHYTIRPKR